MGKKNNLCLKSNKSLQTHLVYGFYLSKLSRYWWLPLLTLFLTQNIEYIFHIHREGSVFPEYARRPGCFLVISWQMLHSSERTSPEDQVRWPQIFKLNYFEESFICLSGTQGIAHTAAISFWHWSRGFTFPIEALSGRFLHLFLMQKSPQWNSSSSAKKLHSGFPF